jgi:Domain of unknown function (DUF4178)
MAATINLSSFPFSHQLSCPHCHATITVYDPSGSEYVVCPGCNSYCKIVSGGNLQVQQLVSVTEYDPVLPIGAEGTLKGAQYKVIGYMEKKEAGTAYEYKWREYMLYNYKNGYAFLAEYEGNWSLIAGKQYYPDLATASDDGSVGSLNGGTYALFNRYTPIITAFAGEYDWDVYEERVLTSEFINPPFILVKEKNKEAHGAIDWYLGEYIENDEIAEGFNIDVETFPEPNDIGANEPNPYSARWDQAWKISVAAMVLLIIVQLTLGLLKPTETILNKSVSLTPPPPPAADTSKSAAATRAASNFYQQSNGGNYEFQSLKTSSFTIFKGPAPVEIEISVPIDNSWFEATLELVSEKDNQTWDVTREVEYYHGYDDGESWSEGSNSGSVTLTNIPAGKYHLNIYPYSGNAFLNEMNITVTANITLWQNIIITILVLCIYPLYCWFRRRQFEVNRWMGNDYSPYRTIKLND